MCGQSVHTGSIPMTFGTSDDPTPVIKYVRVIEATKWSSSLKDGDILPVYHEDEEFYYVSLDESGDVDMDSGWLIERFEDYPYPHPVSATHPCSAFGTTKGHERAAAVARYMERFEAKAAGMYIGIAEYHGNNSDAARLIQAAAAAMGAMKDILRASNAGDKEAFKDAVAAFVNDAVNTGVVVV